MDDFKLFSEINKLTLNRLAENYFAKNLTYPFDDVNMNDMLMNNFVSVNDHNDIMVSYVG